MNKWIIQLDSKQLSNLSEELRQLGDLHTNDRGEHYLIFRDSFVSLKVANSLGTERSQARMVPAGAYNSEPLAELTNGHVLIAA